MNDLFLFIAIGIFTGSVAWVITRQNSYKGLIIKILASTFGSLAGRHVAGTLNFILPNDHFIASLVLSIMGAILPILIITLFRVNR